MKKYIKLHLCFFVCFFFLNVYTVKAMDKPCEFGDRILLRRTCSNKEPSGTCSGGLSYATKINDPAPETSEGKKYFYGEKPSNYNYKILIMFDDSKSMNTQDRIDNVNASIKNLIVTIKDKLQSYGDSYVNNSIVKIRGFTHTSSDIKFNNNETFERGIALNRITDDKADNFVKSGYLTKDTDYVKPLQAAADFVTPNDKNYKYIVVFITDGYPTTYEDRTNNFGYLSSAKYFYKASKEFKNLRANLGGISEDNPNRLVTVGIGLTNNDVISKYLLEPTEDNYKKLYTHSDSKDMSLIDNAEAVRYHELLRGKKEYYEIVMGIGSNPDKGLVGYKVSSVEKREVHFDPKHLLGYLCLDHNNSNRCSNTDDIYVGPVRGTNLKASDFKLCRNSCVTASGLVTKDGYKWVVFSASNANKFLNHTDVRLTSAKDIKWEDYEIGDAGLSYDLNNKIVDKYFNNSGSITSADWLNVLFSNNIVEKCDLDSYGYDVVKHEGNCKKVENISLASGLDDMWYKYEYKDHNVTKYGKVRINSLSVSIMFDENVNFSTGSLQTGQRTLSGQGFDISRMNWEYQLEWNFANYADSSGTVPILNAILAGKEGQASVSYLNIYKGENENTETKYYSKETLLSAVIKSVKEKYPDAPGWNKNENENGNDRVTSINSNSTDLNDNKFDTPVQVLYSKEPVDSGMIPSVSDNILKYYASNIRSYRAAFDGDSTTGLANGNDRNDIIYLDPNASNNNVFWVNKDSEEGWDNSFITHYYTPAKYKGKSVDVNINVPVSLMRDENYRITCSVDVDGGTVDPSYPKPSFRTIDVNNPFPRALGNTNNIPYNWGIWYCNNYSMTSVCEVKTGRIANTYNNLDYFVKLKKSNIRRFNDSSSYNTIENRIYNNGSSKYLDEHGVTPTEHAKYSSLGNCDVDCGLR